MEFEWNSKKPTRFSRRWQGVRAVVEQTKAGLWHVEVWRLSPGGHMDSRVFMNDYANLPEAQFNGEAQFKFALSDQKRAVNMAGHPFIAFPKK